MIGLLQRVASARVVVDGETVGEIDRGLLVLVCAKRGDTEADGAKLLSKLLAFRVFPDERGRMNLSLRDLAGAGPTQAAGLLLVPQFTLAADTRSGTRPSFTPAAPPDQARDLFDRFVTLARHEHPRVETGIFGADMKVHLVNDGPVTFWLETDPRSIKENP